MDTLDARKRYALKQAGLSEGQARKLMGDSPSLATFADYCGVSLRWLETGEFNEEAANEAGALAYAAGLDGDDVDALATLIGVLPNRSAFDWKNPNAAPTIPEVVEALKT